MNDRPITATEFQRRLAALCCGRDLSWPRKRRDRHILFKSVVQRLSNTEPYSEQSLNEALRTWSAVIGTEIQIDHVTLRRYLVDAGYLRRDAHGTAYRVDPDGRGEVEFEPGVLGVDPAAVVEGAWEQAAVRKLKQMEQSR